MAIRSFSGEAGDAIKYLICILSFFIFLLFPGQAAFGQEKTDIGILAGTSYYLGDINHSRHFYKPSPSGGVIVRYNFNSRNSIRFHGLFAMLRGDPKDFEEPTPNSSYSEFTTYLADVGLSTEFNFMPYQATKLRRNRFTPYISGGFGYSFILGGKPAAALSFGGGFKYNLTRRMSGGAEWSFRKTFSDQLDDGALNPGYENNVFFHNKDWFSIVGVFITYKIFDWGLDCPAYE